MLKNFLTNQVKGNYSKRDIYMEKLKKIFHFHETIGCNTYLLNGLYSYDEVCKLNAITSYNAGYGYCFELGPIAFIGIPNPEYARKSGYFKYKVHSYGSSLDESEYYFKAYTDDDAKNIGNYTVYGLNGLRDIAKLAPISQMKYVYDSRYIAKDTNFPEILTMDCKLKGLYSYNDACLLASKNVLKKKLVLEEEQSISFAELGNGKHIGILNMWSYQKELAHGFRDVWEYGCQMPETQLIHFLTEEKASNIQDFSLYVYMYHDSGILLDNHQVEKYDRTFDKKFNFILPDGNDCRLIL